MADEHPPSGLEQAANAAHPNMDSNTHAAGEAAHGKPAVPKKPATTLESVVNETSNLFGSALKLGLAGAIPYTFANTFPSLKTDTAILTGAQIASDYTTSLQTGRKYSPGNLLESAVIGTAITGPLEAMFGTVNKMALNTPLDYITKAGVWGGLMYPAFNGLYLPIAYLVRNKTFKGMGKYVKENYWPILKKSWKYILPFSLLNVFFAPAALQIPIAATLSFVYDRFTAHKGEVKEDQKRDKTPYLAAAPGAVSKLVRNSVKGLYDSVYAIGSSVADLYKSSPKAAAPVQSAPAGAAHH